MKNTTKYKNLKKILKKVDDADVYSTPWINGLMFSVHNSYRLLKAEALFALGFEETDFDTVNSYGVTNLAIDSQKNQFYITITIIYKLKGTDLEFYLTNLFFEKIKGLTSTFTQSDLCKSPNTTTTPSKYKDATIITTRYNRVDIEPELIQHAMIVDGRIWFYHGYISPAVVYKNIIKHNKALTYDDLELCNKKK